MQVVLGAVAVVLIALVAWRLFGRRVGLVAGVLATVYPPLVLSSVALLSESVYVPLEVGAILAALAARRATGRRAVVSAVLCGVLGGLGVLARPNSLVVLALLCVLVLPRGWRARARIHLVVPAAVLAAAVLVVAPWEIRNVVVVHSAVPISNIDGFNLAGVYNNDAGHEPLHTRYQFRPPVGVAAFAPLFHDATLTEVQLSTKLRSAGLTYIRHHPLAPVEAAALNSARMLELTGQQVGDLSGVESGYGHRAAVLSRLAFWLFALLAVAGAVTKRRARPPWSLLLMPVALWLVTVPFLSAPRLRVPVEPFLVIAAAVAIGELGMRMATRARSEG